MKRREFLKSLGVVTAGVALAPRVVKKKAVGIPVSVSRPDAIVDNLGVENVLSFGSERLTIDGVDLGETEIINVLINGICEFFVTGQDEQGDRRIVVGDPLCFHQDTGVVDGSRGMVIGYANGVVEPGETKVINVLIDESPAYWTTQIYGDMGWTKA